MSSVSLRPRARRLTSPLLPLALAAALAAAGPALARPQPEGRNLGPGLHELVRLSAGRTMATADLRAAIAAQPGAMRQAVLDAGGRVRVNVHLDGRQALPAVQAAASRLGATATAARADYRRGVFSAWVPVARVPQLATLAGVKSVHLSVAPVADVGTVTAEGAAVVRADKVNALGALGAGITVGILSDSWDVSTSTTIRAAADVASGDLPGPGNPNGFTQPVVVLEDIASGIDEGRAMAQIIHDTAPAAKLCFVTAFTGDVAFADNIRKLADPAGPCKADVIVDDIIYFTEPMFSDGVIAQAADDVAAAGVSYFSSAGNRGSSQGYLAGFSPVSFADAQAANPTLNLAAIGAGNALGGVHNLAPGGTTDVGRTVQVSGSSNSFVLQWNDPYDAGRVSADYDLYLFSADGSTLVAASAADNFGSDQPVEFVSVGPGTYQIVVVRFDTAPTQANLVRFVTFGTVVTGEYLNYTTPITYGHNSAAGAIGTAAVPWYQPYLPEGFTSPGPSQIHFDRAGNRLPVVEVRQKPDLAAPDGVNTTFFIGDTFEDADTFPNFFGTSAAAPAAAAVAALALEAAGGPGSLSPSEMRTLLQSTANRHDLATSFIRAAADAGGAAKVVVSAFGDGTSWSQFDPNAFQVKLVAPAGYTLENVTIDVAPANPNRTFLGNPAPGMQFDPRVGSGLPLTIGTTVNLSATDVSFTPLSGVAPFSKQLTVSFAPGTFGATSRLAFGVDRDEVATGGGGNSMDLLVGGTIAGTVRGPGGEAIPFSAAFQQKRERGWSPLLGYGVVDAQRAAKEARALRGR